MLWDIGDGSLDVLRNVGLDAIGVSVIQDGQRSEAIVEDLKLLFSIGHPRWPNHQAQHVFGKLTDSIISLS